jgi:hypothetical protein
MMAKKETAEQKLLKMIETSSSSTGDVPAKKQQKSGGFNFYALLRTLNQILMLVSVGGVVFCVNEVMAGMNYMSRAVDVSAGMSSNGASAKKDFGLPKTVPVDSYLSVVKKRNLFLPYEEMVKVVDGEVVQKKSKLTDQLKLVGISWLDSVESASAMVEDTEKKMTYFLMKGDKVGDLTVKTIYADSVKFGYQGEEIMIKYDKSQM